MIKVLYVNTLCLRPVVGGTCLGVSPPSFVFIRGLLSLFSAGRWLSFVRYLHSCVRMSLSVTSLVVKDVENLNKLH